jgi:hypothetical protein
MGMTQSGKRIRGDEMQFEVNGQVYVLAMLPPDGGLGLFAPTLAGLKRLPIYDDGEEEVLVMSPEKDGGKVTLN